MTMKKAFAIGIIALFIGLSFSPVSNAKIKEEESMIPIEISTINSDGSRGMKTISLTKSDVLSLLDLLDSMKKPGKRPNDFFDRFKDLFDRDDKLIDDIGLLSKLPGHPIVSIGEGRDLFSRYHGRVQFKKLVTVWNYPNDVGATIIWGNGLTSVPTQVLLQKQIGIMFGFVGVYIYIPPLLNEMNSKTCFVGSSLFAWGISA